MASGTGILARLRRVPPSKAGVLSLAASAALLAMHATRFEDSARFAGDAWEYQSVAVNLVKGRGFPKFGELAPFPEYRFEEAASRAAHYPRFAEAGKAGGLDHFYRNPGYPLFLAAVYGVFGVHPLAAKLAQSLLLLLVAGALMRVGRMLWGEDGFYAGALAGPVYAAVYGYQAGHILTEPLIAASLAVVVEAFQRWRRRPDLSGAAAVGAALALSLYVKSSNLFIPPLVALLLWRAAPGVRAASPAAALAAMLVLLAPYSAFATARTGALVVLSTQGPTSLLDNNNEYSLATRAWGPQWRDDPEAFYNRPDIAGLPPLAKVAAFYSSRPAALVRAASYKLDAGFRDAVFLKAVVAVLLAEAILRVWAGWTRRRSLAVPALGRLFLLGASAAVFAASALQWLGTLPLAALVAAALWAAGGGRVGGLFPGIHGALLGNFILIFVIFDGAPRFFSPAQPFFMLLALRVAFATVFDLDAWARTAVAAAPQAPEI